jgi:AcrR family transcriptional regulator
MSRSVVFDRFGGPEVLRIVEEPVVEPAAGEARIRIEAFAVNPLDLMMRSGRAPVPVPLPHARLGVEGTGVVDALGPDVAGLEVGDPVILAAIPDASVRGSYAEHTTVPASRLIARPPGLGIEEAAAVLVAYPTAYGALVEKARMRPGDRVLISAASGAVGRAAIQIANHLGAVPIAVTRQAAKRDELLAFGAAAVVATDEQDVAAAVGAARRRHRARPGHGPRPAGARGHTLGGAPVGGPARCRRARRGAAAADRLRVRLRRRRRRPPPRRGRPSGREGLRQGLNHDSLLGVAYRSTERTEARRLAARERIVEAAHELIAADGYRAAGVAAVAAEAEVATGSVYRHFPSKADLFAEVFRRASQREVDAVSAALAEGGVTAGVETFARRALRGRRLAWALLAEPVDPVVEAERLVFRVAFRDAFAAALPAHVADRPLIAAALVGAIGEALVGPLSPSSDDIDEDHLVAALVAFALRSLSAEEPVPC